MYKTRLINYHTPTSSPPPLVTARHIHAIYQCYHLFAPASAHVIFAKPLCTHPTEHVRPVIKFPIWQARCCLYPLPSHPHTTIDAICRPCQDQDICTQETRMGKVLPISALPSSLISREVQIDALSPFLTRFNLWCWQVGIRNLLRGRSQDRGYAKEEDLRWEITAEMRFRSHQGGSKMGFLSV